MAQSACFEQSVSPVLNSPREKHEPALQSEFFAQPSPLAQLLPRRTHSAPPQSVSVSSSVFLPSLHVTFGEGFKHLCVDVLQLPLAQSLSLPQPWPTLQRTLQTAPQSLSLSPPSILLFLQLTHFWP
jgi:hypothetical protein